MAVGLMAVGLMAIGVLETIDLLAIHVDGVMTVRLSHISETMRCHLIRKTEEVGGVWTRNTSRDTLSVCSDA